MLKDGTQIIEHDGKKYNLINAGYRWIQHKWSFTIQGHDSPIFHGQKITFLETEMTVTFTSRGQAEHHGHHKTETFIEAWIL